MCKAKINQEIDLDWSEIAQILGLKISRDHLRKTAYGLKEYDDYLNKRYEVATRILSISDLHIPFNLPVSTFDSYKNKVDILQINGDITDCFSLSKFPKTYRKSPMEEILATWEYLYDLIVLLNPKKVVVNYGNHDVRLQAYLAKHLDTDILELMPKTSLELILVDGFRRYSKETNKKVYYEPLCSYFPEIEVVYTDNWFCQIGDAIFCHPTAYSSGILKTSEKALLWFRNEEFKFKTLVTAHTHKSGMATIGNTTIFEQGACCDVQKMKYTDGKLINSQKEGFLYMAQDKDGNTIKDLSRLVVLN